MQPASLPLDDTRLRSVLHELGLPEVDPDGTLAALFDAQAAIGECLSLSQPSDRLGAELSRTGGSGLGFVIPQRLVEAMGGRLRVASRAGSGSVFTVELAAAAGDRGTPGSRSDSDSDTAPPPLPPGPRKVLYIEDEPLNMVLMEEVFRTHSDWTLLVADTGEAGMRIACESQPDLVLVDMNLPDMNGLALIGLLRGDARTRGLRCIALSADTMREQIEAALAAGFDDYWTKPIDVQRVLNDLARLLA